ncbi:tetratricopeptide repeat protein [Erythrobacter sp. F6033]|uniref:tetratricopeptide repeat protein n=1 Tax=Erythrobacter sp. F6033 TaxID=2926401 RepID=UPI001FF2843F|nr:tetratricopeptide repeat protein [Erythrobacter sp. F6033]MCK0127668.1 tetratricopeptide repeat protein [Erythrobacter sp. F6033]
MGLDNEMTEADTDTNAKTEGSSKAGWILLGAAALLAAGSVAYNVMDAGGGEETEQVAASGQPSIEDLRKLAEASSDDAGAWGDLAYAHFEQGEFAEAAAAYEKAVEIDAGAAILWSALGEARVMANDSAAPDADPLPAAAMDAFAKALAIDDSDPRARYFMAVKKDVDGDHAGAIADWLDLLSDTPPGAPWEQNLVETIQQVGAINDIDVAQRLAAVSDGRMPVANGPAASNVRGPSEAELAAASAIPPGEQRTMAEGMVAQLEARLQSEPDNLDGWVMLMRSRMTLGEPGKAKTALTAAVAANPDYEGELKRQAQALGVPQ